MFETQGRADATRVGTLHERDPPGDPPPRQTGNQHNIRSHEEFTHVLDHRRHGCPGPHRSAQRARRRQAPGEGRPPLSEFRPRRNFTQVRRPAGAADFLHTLTGTRHHSPTSRSTSASPRGHATAAGPGRGAHGQRSATYSRGYDEACQRPGPCCAAGGRGTD